MCRLNRPPHRRRVQPRGLPPRTGRPRDQRIRIDVTITLHRRGTWLLAGIVIGTARLTDGLLETVYLMAQALRLP